MKYRKTKISSKLRFQTGSFRLTHQPVLEIFRPILDESRKRGLLQCLSHWNYQGPKHRIFVGDVKARKDHF